MKDTLRPKVAMPRLPWSMMSRLPISTKRPKSAHASKLSRSKSWVREFKTTSTPWPEVAERTSGRNEESSKLKMWSGLRSNVSTKKFLLASLPTVAKIYCDSANVRISHHVYEEHTFAPICFATWIAAIPTPPAAE